MGDSTAMPASKAMLRQQAIGRLTQERLRSILHYDELTGYVYKIRADKPMRRTGQYATSTGYRAVRVDGVLYALHRLVWFHKFGEWPDTIDHINRIKSDNRIANLRNVTGAENRQNMELTARNKSGFRGVYYSKRMRRWTARISVKSKQIHLGYFDNAETAAAAYARAATQHHKYNPYAQKVNHD